MADEIAVPATPLGTIATLQNESFGNDLFKAAGGSDVFIGFLPRMQLFTSNSQEVKKGKITLAHYGLIKGKEKELIDLGKQVILAPIAWRPKSLDTKTDPVMAYHNPKSAEFQALKKRADDDNNSGCMYGPEFLVFLPDHGFVTFFFGSKTARNESPKLRALLPVGTDVFKNALVTAQFIETKEFSWHGPSVMPTTQKIELPDIDVINSVASSFLKPKDSEIQEVADATTTNADR